MKELRKIIDRQIAQEGLQMRKQIRASSSGFFHYHPAVFDIRTVRSYKDGAKLNDEGYRLVDGADIGILLLNAIMEI